MTQHVVALDGAALQLTSSARAVFEGALTVRDWGACAPGTIEPASPVAVSDHAPGGPPTVSRRTRTS